MVRKEMFGEPVKSWHRMTVEPTQETDPPGSRDRLSRRDWMLLGLSLAILFGLFQSGHATDYNRPDRAFQISWHRPESDRGPLGVLRGLQEALHHHYNKGSEERLYLSYANLFLGHPIDDAAFAEHRGSLGEFGALLIPPPNPTGRPLRPYIDVGLEYPPVNLPFLTLPRLVSTTPFDYFTVYALEMGLVGAFSLVVGLFCLAPPLGLSREETTRYLAGSALGLLALGHLFTTRLDLVLTVFLVITLVYAFRGRAAWSGIALALAAGAKLFPLLLVPLLATYFYRRGGLRRACNFALAWTITTGLIFLPWAFLGGEKFWVMFRFHGSRPIQVESTYSSLVMVWRLLTGQAMEIGHFQGSFNLISSWDPFFRAFSTLGTLLMPVAVAAVFWSRTRSGLGSEQTKNLLVRATLCFITSLMLISKVFSPQYLIWLWPLVFLLRGKDSTLCQSLALLSTALTQLVFPTFYAELVVQQSLGPILILLARNLTLLACCYALWEGYLWPERAERNGHLLRKRWQTLTGPAALAASLGSLALYGYLARGWVLWSSSVFGDPASSLWNGWAQDHLFPLPCLPLKALNSLSLGSVQTAILSQQLGLVALMALLAWSLRRDGRGRLVSLGWAALLCLGSSAETNLLSLNGSGYAAVGTLLALISLREYQKSPSRFWLGAMGLGWAVALTSDAAALSGLLVAVGWGAARRRAALLLSAMVLAAFVSSFWSAQPTALFWALHQAPPGPALADPMLWLLTLGALRVGLLGAKKEPVASAYLGLTLVVTAALMISGTTTLVPLLQLKVASLWVLGLNWDDARFERLRKPFILILLVYSVGRIVFLSDAFFRPYPTQRALQRVILTTRDGSLLSDSSFLLTESDRDCHVVQKEKGFFYATSLSDAPYEHLVLEDENGTFFFLDYPSGSIPARAAYRFWYHRFQSQAALSLEWWQEYAVESVFQHFVVLGPRTGSEALRQPPSLFREIVPDAAVRDRWGRLTLFQGQRCWSIRGASQAVYPGLIAQEWPGIPDHLDGAFGFNNVIYFFKNDQYWRWNQDSWSISPGYPRAISEGWKGLPGDLKAVTPGPGKSTYFFKDGQVWVWDMGRDRLIESGPVENFWPALRGHPTAAVSGVVPSEQHFWVNGEHQLCPLKL